MHEGKLLLRSRAQTVQDKEEPGAQVWAGDSLVSKGWIVGAKPLGQARAGMIIIVNL